MLAKNYYFFFIKSNKIRGEYYQKLDAVSSFVEKNRYNIIINNTDVHVIATTVKF